MSALRCGAALALLAAALLSPSPCLAQTRETASADERARAEYEIGRGEFRLGHYAAAARAFRESYAISRQPLLLYNIAQAERKAGELQAARDDFRGYLAERPDAPDRAEVERTIAELDRALALHPASPPPQATSGAAPTPPPDIPSPKPNRSAQAAAIATTAVPGGASPTSPAPALTVAGAARAASIRKRRIALGVGLGVGALVVVGTVLAVTLTVPPGPPHAPLGEYRPFP